MKFKVIFTIYSGIMGLSVGILSALFLVLVNFSVHTIWNTFPKYIQSSYYPLIFGIVGGCLVGWTQTKLGAYPRTMHETLTEFKTTKRISYRGSIWKNFIASIIVLSFGASLGPEAALASILGGLISWIGDHIKLTLANREKLIDLSIGAMLATIFRAPLVGISSPIDASIKSKSFNIKWKKILLYSFTTFLGLVGFSFTNHFFPKEKVFAIHLSEIHWQFNVVYMIMPAFIIGLLFGFIFLKIENFSDLIANKIKNPFLLAIFGGFLIGVMGIISPYFLFSGEHDLLEFTAQASQLSLFSLLLIAFGKTFLTHFCFSFGWRGGKIFPAIFTSVAIGLALVHFFPYTPGLIISIVTATSITVILRNPIITATLLLFLFPLQFSPFILISCLAAQGIIQATVNRHS